MSGEGASAVRPHESTRPRWGVRLERGSEGVSAAQLRSDAYKAGGSYGRSRWYCVASTFVRLSIFHAAVSRQGHAGMLGQRRIIGNAVLHPNSLAVLFDLFPFLQANVVLM
nr:uncharacterized protein LOC127314429 [Lolium perenne]